MGWRLTRRGKLLASGVGLVAAVVAAAALIRRRRPGAGTAGKRKK